MDPRKLRQLRRRTVAAGAFVLALVFVELGLGYTDGPWWSSVLTVLLIAAAVGYLCFVAVMPVIRQLETRFNELETLNSVLAQREDQYRRLLEGLPDAVGVYQDGRWVYVNPAGLAEIGVEGFAALAEDPKVGDRLKAAITAAENTGGAPAGWGDRRRSSRVLLPDGGPPVSATAMAIRYGGRPAALVVLRSLAAVDEDEQQLYLIRRLEAVGRLAGGVAHDFNNLLVVIHGNTRLALDALGPDHPVAEDLQQVLQASERTKRVTQQLLAFSRRAIVRPEHVDVGELLTDWKDDIAAAAGASVAVEILLPETPLHPVYVDTKQFKQVIRQLSANAGAAMPDGGPLVIEARNAYLDAEYAHLRPGADIGDYVMVSVTDRGPGIPKDRLPYLFDPFSGGIGAGTGSGLGLATCYGIIKQAGGNIWAFSEEGVGTTFKLYLPAVDGAGDPTEDPAAGSGREEETDGDGTATILVAEDEAGVRRLAVRILEQAGYRVLAAADAGAALDVARREGARLDLLLTDVVMPGRDGPQLAEAVRELAPGCSVLYMSGYPGASIEAPGRLIDRVNFLEKPFDKKDLLRVVQVVLQRSNT